jgi:sugar phosphate isomerase/epimerase
MDIRTLGLPFRVGATSYIVPDDLLPNARFLAPHVQDMQLVLFEVAGGPTNLPAAEIVQELAAFGQAQDLTYTVHLLHDLRLADANQAPSLALRKAQQVIDLTRSLRPWAWVGHLDGRPVRSDATSLAQLVDWQHQTGVAVAQVAAWLDTPAHLAIENLEGYPPDFVTPVVGGTSVSRCVDIGHLWLDGQDPVPPLRSALPRLRVVHLHGIHERDHASLAHMPPARLDPVVGVLLEAGFDGVVTLEIFGEEDFWSSLDALAAAVQRIRSSTKAR